MANQTKGEAPKTSFFSKFLAKPISYFIFILWTLITVAPLIWMLYSSFKTNEELTKDIYSMPKELFHARDGYLDVVEPQTNIKYPNGMLEKLGIVNAAGKGDTKNRTEINKQIMILESPNIGAHKRIKVHFIVRDDLPADLKTSDGRILRDIQPGEGVQVKVSDFPLSVQAKISWQTVWWNYTSAWIRGELGLKFINSIIYTIVSTFLVVLLGLMLGYGTTKFKYKKVSAIIAAAIGLGYLLDVNQLLVPLFLMLTKMKLTNTHIGIILVYVAFGLPMSVMLSSTYIRGLPYSLVESAYIDGATPFRTFISIIVPMTVPVIVTISIMTALGIWNEFLLVLVMASAESTKSLPVGIFSFSSRTGIQLGWQIAALIIATVPVLVVYFSSQKKLAEGVAGGAIKE
ncbi:MAG: carbohydrate ABC transporter permease [Treponema sp.]|nr:carbohydrate ABC transporter permease [Treponema sp.]